MDGTCPPGQRCFVDTCWIQAPDAAVPDGAPPDGPTPDAMPPDASPCDPVGQDCAGILACYVTPGGGTVCATAGTSMEHEPCGENGDCREGLGCEDGPSGPECTPYCHVDDPVECMALDDCVPIPGTTNVGACIFGGCDPILQDCTPAESCYWETMEGVGRCFAPGAGTQGQACEPPNDCAEGFQCQNCGAASFACSRYCELDGDPGCTDLGETCMALSGNLGVCNGCP